MLKSLSSSVRFITAVAVLIPLLANAQSFDLSEKDALLGDITYAKASAGQTIADITNRYNIGLNALIAANPGLKENTIFRKTTELKVPTQFLIPPLPRQGIVINLPEMRMYFFPSDSKEVMTFPIGIGKIGKTIPIKKTSIVRKINDPVWIPTPDIRKYNEERGIVLPKVMPPGPDNPLGPYAIYLQIPTYLIHSTIFPDSIGRRASFGCIRMNPNDIEQLFPLVNSGMPVTIINMPVKVAWDENYLFIEAHTPLEEHNQNAIQEAMTHITNMLPKDKVVLIDWQSIPAIVSKADGIPHKIGELVKF